MSGIDDILFPRLLRCRIEIVAYFNLFLNDDSMTAESDFSRDGASTASNISFLLAFQFFGLALANSREQFCQFIESFGRLSDELYPSEFLYLLVVLNHPTLTCKIFNLEQL